MKMPLLKELQLKYKELKNQIPKGQATGESITLNDSSNLPYKKFVIKGKSEQETREGKNYIDINKHSNNLDNGTTIIDSNSYKCDLSKFTEGTAWKGLITLNLDNLKTSTDYVISLDYENTNPHVTIRKTSNDIIASGYMKSYAEGLSFNTGEENSIIVQIYATGNTNEYSGLTTISNIMLEEGNKKGSFEKYGASPSPKYPSEIRSVADNINLFNCTNWHKMVQDMGYPDINQDINEQINIIESSRNSIKFHQNQPYYGIASDYIEVKNGQKLTLSFDYININRLYIDLYDTNKIRVKTLNAPTILNSTIIDIEQDGYILIAFSYSNATPSVDDIEINNIKLEKGTVATPYSPHGCGNVNFKIINENLLNVPEEFTLAGPGTRTKSVSVNMPAGEYTVKATQITTNKATKILIIAYYKDDNGSKYIYINTNEPKTVFNLEKEADLVTICSNYDYAVSADTTTTFKQLMIYDGTEDKQYIEHQEQSFSFPTKQGQVLHKGDYLADDGIHINKRTKIITSEDIHNNLRYWDDTKEFFGIDIGGFTKIRRNDNKNNGLFYCNMINNPRADWSGLINLTDYDLCFITESAICLSLKKTDIGGTINSTKEECFELMKEFVTNNQLIVEYPVFEDIDPYSPEQQEAYNEIKKLKSYKGVTHIFSEDEVKPSFDIEYYQDLETLLKKEVG